MKSFYLTLLLVTALILNNCAQDKGDKAAVRETVKNLIAACSVDWLDDKVTELGMFYKAAQYIVYRGEDESRKWKDFANYEDEKEKQYVDDVCYRINTIIGGGDIEFGKFSTEDESEGTWYVQEVKYGQDFQKTAIFAFLKIGDRFALGDID